MKYPSWPVRGDIVSVIYSGPGYQIVVGMTVKKPGHEIRCVWVDQLGGRHNFHVRLRDEGRTWARGVDGPAAEALRVYVALT